MLLILFWDSANSQIDCTYLLSGQRLLPIPNWWCTQEEGHSRRRWSCWHHWEGLSSDLFYSCLQEVFVSLTIKLDPLAGAHWQLHVPLPVYLGAKPAGQLCHRSQWKRQEQYAAGSVKLTSPVTFTIKFLRQSHLVYSGTQRAWSGTPRWPSSSRREPARRSSRWLVEAVGRQHNNIVFRSPSRIVGTTPTNQRPTEEVSLSRFTS